MANKAPASFWENGIRHTVSHAFITLLAVGAAFSLPVVSQYILFYWWPRVEGNAHILLGTEIVFAAALVMLFNLAKYVWDSRLVLRAARISGLQDVWSLDGVGRWYRRRMDRALGKSREILVLSVTGREIFCNDDSVFNKIIDECYAIRVLLMKSNLVKQFPKAVGVPEAGSASNEEDLDVTETITALGRLRMSGKNVSVKFYDHSPLWQILVLREYMLFKSHDASLDKRTSRKYLVAYDDPHQSQGLYQAFYMHALNEWNNPLYSEYSFETGEILQSLGEIARAG